MKKNRTVTVTEWQTEWLNWRSPGSWIITPFRPSKTGRAGTYPLDLEHGAQ